MDRRPQRTDVLVARVKRRAPIALMVVLIAFSLCPLLVMFSWSNNCQQRLSIPEPPLVPNSILIAVPVIEGLHNAGPYDFPPPLTRYASTVLYYEVDATPEQIHAFYAVRGEGCPYVESCYGDTETIRRYYVYNPGLRQSQASTQYRIEVRWNQCGTFDEY